MSVSIAPYPRFKAFYPASGNPLSGGYLYTVQPGTSVQFGISPSYPMPTYTDSTGLVQNANPIVLDGNGEADVWLSGYTKLVLFDANGNLVWSKDNVSSSPALQSASLQWVPQSTQVTFLSATSSQRARQPDGRLSAGTAVLATMTGATAIGIVESSSAGGTPVVTTVNVAWYSTQLNNSVTAVATGIMPEGAPGSTPCFQRSRRNANDNFQPTDSFDLRRELGECHAAHPARREQRALGGRTMTSSMRGRPIPRSSARSMEAPTSSSSSTPERKSSRTARAGGRNSDPMSGFRTHFRCRYLRTCYAVSGVGGTKRVFLRSSTNHRHSMKGGVHVYAIEESDDDHASVIAAVRYPLAGIRSQGEDHVLAGRFLNRRDPVQSQGAGNGHDH